MIDRPDIWSSLDRPFESIALATGTIRTGQWRQIKAGEILVKVGMQVRLNMVWHDINR
jgi:hypothetical protein